MSSGQRDVQLQKPESKREPGKLEESKEISWDWIRVGKGEGMKERLVVGWAGVPL